jgi:replicative DNA helicase
MKEDKKWVDYGKIPPCNLELEEAILGACLIEPDSFLLAGKLLIEECFYSNVNKIIFSAMKSLQEKAYDIDLLTVTDELRQKNQLEEIGGPFVISLMSTKVLSAQHIDTHIKIIFELYLKRKIIEICYDNLENAFKGDMDPFEIKDKIISELEKVFDIGKFQKEYFNDTIDKVLESMREIQELGYNPNVLTTDTFMDKLVTIEPNNIIFIAASPKQAKTKIITFTIHNLLKKYKDKIAVCWYSMEDDTETIIMNRIALDTGISLKSQAGDPEHPKLTTGDLMVITETAMTFKNDPVEMVSKRTRMSTISSHFREFCSKNSDKINILVIDNFFICVGEENDLKNSTEKEARVADIIQGLNAKVRSQGYKALIFVLDHLNKELFKDKINTGFRPTQDMLKGSSRKHEIMTQLVLLNKPGEYKTLVSEEDSKPNIKIGSMYYKRKDVLEHLLILEKSVARKGPTNTPIVRLAVDLTTMKIYPLKEIYKLVTPIKNDDKD